MTAQRVGDITEDDQGRILVTLVPDASSFRSGQALWMWSVTSTGSGSRVIHRATLAPDFWLPPWIGTAILKATLVIETLTDAMVAIEGESSHAYTLVLIEDSQQGDWSVGGKMLTAADVHRLQRTVAA
jgi:4-oxalocrotonate tautomerase